MRQIAKRHLLTVAGAAHVGQNKPASCFPFNREKESVRGHQSNKIVTTGTVLGKYFGVTASGRIYDVRVRLGVK